MSYPRFFIDPSTPIRDAKIWHFAVVQKGVKLGRGVSIGSHAEISEGCVIGDNARISRGVFLPKNSVIGSNVFIGPNCTFTDDRYPRANNPYYYADPPIIEDHASIGAGCVILPGVRIGRGAMVGAGTIVVRDVEPFCKVYLELTTVVEILPDTGAWQWMNLAPPRKQLHSLPRTSTKLIPRGQRRD